MTSHRTSAKRLSPTPMCPKCPIYLVGCGCIHELGYEETGICNAGIDAAIQSEREKVLYELEKWSNRTGASFKEMEELRGKLESLWQHKEQP